MQSDPWNSTCLPGPVFNRLPEVGCLPPTAPISVSTYTTTGSWAHTVPSPMPWGGGGPPFTGAPPDPCTSSTATSWELLHHAPPPPTHQHHLKRKGGTDAEGPRPSKLCVTEERMAARFQEMHISNQFVLPPELAAPGPLPPVDTVTNLHQLDCILKECETNPKSLVLAPELKKLVEPEKIFASTFLSKVERPSMAVVLWQPQKATQLPEEDKKENKENPCFLPSHLSALCTQHLLSNLHSKDAKLEQTSFDVEMDGDTT